ncbi:MAG: hypothetical protein IPN89_18450 [Saprospiraceae bacterium]|nr:hypothetical protein [Saprospiraceae bacterium]
MNTQWPEWNDANTALWGQWCFSMVTLYCREKVFNFFERVVAQSHEENITLISKELVTFSKIWQTLSLINMSFPEDWIILIRKVITDALGTGRKSIGIVFIIKDPVG